jgi:predicted Zn-dependent protease
VNRRTTKPKDTLSEEATWHLQRCDGFLDLKMTDKARRELEQIDVAHRQSDPFIEAELRLAMADSRWSDAAQFARTLSERQPNEPVFCIQLAYSVRRGESVEAARNILLDAKKRFPKVAVIPFNLACYECQLGHPDEAMAFLEKTFKLDAHFREQAFEDDDLKPIWDKLGQ